MRVKSIADGQGWPEAWVVLGWRFWRETRGGIQFGSRMGQNVGVAGSFGIEEKEKRQQLSEGRGHVYKNGGESGNRKAPDVSSL